MSLCLFFCSFLVLSMLAELYPQSPTYNTALAMASLYVNLHIKASVHRAPDTPRPTAQRCVRFEVRALAHSLTAPLCTCLVMQDFKESFLLAYFMLHTASLLFDLNWIVQIYTGLFMVRPRV